jgi:thiamine phosphate synthase YjbQ (UPF0047 family)
MKSHTEYLTFNLPHQMSFERITEKVRKVLQNSGIQEGLCLVNSMHITSGVA